MASAGCVSDKEKDCPTAGPCPPNTLEPGITVPPQANQTISFEGCAGGLGNGQVPYDQIRPHVPSAFAVHGYSPDTVTTFYGAVACERVVIDSTVFANVSYFESAVFVTPRNEAWSVDAVNYYLFDQRASIPELVAAIQPQTLLCQEAEFDLTTTTPPAGDAKERAWIVSNPSSGFAFRYTTANHEYLNENFTLQLWSGQDEFHRIQSEFNDSLDIAGPPGILELSGSSRTREILGDKVAGFHREIISSSMKWTLSGETFKEEKS